MAIKKIIDGIPIIEPDPVIQDIRQASAIAIETAVSAIPTPESLIIPQLNSVATAPIAAPSFAGLPKPATEVKPNMEKVMKTAEEMVTFGQGNLEAFTRSGQIWAAGVQDMGKQFAANAQAQMQHTVATMKALAGVKSIKDAMDLQSGLARASIEKAMAETGKLTDASMKLAEQTMAPLAARMTLAMEKFGRSV